MRYKPLQTITRTVSRGLLCAGRRVSDWLTGAEFKDGDKDEFMERHFHCTACGKCCFGWLPLTVDEAVAHAGNWPLAMVWTPIRKGAKAFELAKRLGTTVRLLDRRDVAVMLVPTAYIPPSLPCPLLAADGRCSIHETKPLRCRSMPFYPWQEEADQRNFLVPRPGWQCDVSEAAPVVYRDKKILARDDFDHETAALTAQASELRAYADMVLKMTPTVVGQLTKAAANPAGGKIVLSFSSLLRAVRRIDATAFAERQIPVLRDYAALTADDAKLADYHRQYTDMAVEMERYLPR